MQLGIRNPWDTDKQLVDAAWGCGKPVSAVRDTFCRQGSWGAIYEKGIAITNGKWWEKGLTGIIN